MIKSSKNEVVKYINKLKKKKYRDEYNSFIIESKKLIDEAIKTNLEIEYMLHREDCKNIYPNSISVDKTLFKDISSLISSDGYIAIVKKKLIESFELGNNVLVLDHIQDPGNMGTLIRSAEAFGFNTIISINSVDYYNEKVLRATMGSIFRLNLLVKDYNFLEENMKDYQLLVADMNGENYRDLNYNNKLALIISNEGNGLSEDIKKLSFTKLKIPMKGQIESLNAAISGSIIMAEISK